MTGTGVFDTAFREVVNTRLKELGLSVARFTAKTGFSRNVVYRFLSTTKSCSRSPTYMKLKTTLILAEALGWSGAELVDRIEQHARSIRAGLHAA